MASLNSALMCHIRMLSDTLTHSSVTPMPYYAYIQHMLYYIQCLVACVYIYMRVGGTACLAYFLVGIAGWVFPGTH